MTPGFTGKHRESRICPPTAKSNLRSGQNGRPQANKTINAALSEITSGGGWCKQGRPRHGDRPFVEYGGRHLVSPRSAAGPEVRRLLEMVHRFANRVVGGEERRKHRAADVGRVRAGDDGVFDFDGAADRDRRPTAARDRPSSAHSMTTSRQRSGNRSIASTASANSCRTLTAVTTSTSSSTKTSNVSKSPTETSCVTRLRRRSDRAARAENLEINLLH